MAEECCSGPLSAAPAVGSVCCSAFAACQVRRLTQRRDMSSPATDCHASHMFPLSAESATHQLLDNESLPSAKHLDFLVPPLSMDDLLRLARDDVNASGPPASRSVPPP